MVTSQGGTEGTQETGEVTVEERTEVTPRGNSQIQVEIQGLRDFSQSIQDRIQHHLQPLHLVHMGSSTKVSL